MNNFAKVYTMAIEKDINQGRSWYPKVWAWCKERGAQYGINPFVVAGVVAIVSPRLTWKRNLKQADVILGAFRGQNELRSHGAFWNAIHKADELLYTEDFSLISGNKVRAFYASIIGSSDSVAAIDAWMVKIHYGDLDGTFNTPSDNQYYQIEQALFDAMIEVGFVGTLPEFQAIVWTTSRRLAKLQLTFV